MIDFISITANASHISEAVWGELEPDDWEGIKFRPFYIKGHLWAYKGEYRGLQLVLHDRQLKITNSLHKFYKGNNYTDFSYSEIKAAISLLSGKFHISPADFNIKKLEFGLNIILEKYALHYINYFLSYKNKFFDKMRSSHKEYGRKCFLSEYDIKVYDKQLQVNLKDKIKIESSLLRFEVAYKQQRAMPKIKTLADLESYEKLEALFLHFIGVIGKVVTTQNENFEATTASEREIYAAAKDPNYLIVEKKMRKDGAIELQRKIRLAREKILTGGLNDYFINALTNKYFELLKG